MLLLAAALVIAFAGGLFGTLAATSWIAACNARTTGDPGSAGSPPSDTIRADKGTVDIRNTGAGGSITLNTAQISADTVKIGALVSNGTLSIGSVDPRLRW